MIEIFYVDIPKYPLPNEEDSWVNVDIFYSLEEAEKFVLDTWGIRKEDAHMFISPGTTEEDE